MPVEAASKLELLVASKAPFVSVQEGSDKFVETAKGAGVAAAAAGKLKASTTIEILERRELLQAMAVITAATSAAHLDGWLASEFEGAAGCSPTNKSF